MSKSLSQRDGIPIGEPDMKHSDWVIEWLQTLENARESNREIQHCSDRVRWSDRLL